MVWACVLTTKESESDVFPLPPLYEPCRSHLVHLGVTNPDDRLVLLGADGGPGAGQRGDDAQAQLAGHGRGHGVADLRRDVSEWLENDALECHRREAKEAHRAGEVERRGRHMCHILIKSKAFHHLRLPACNGRGQIQRRFSVQCSVPLTSSSRGIPEFRRET